MENCGGGDLFDQIDDLLDFPSDEHQSIQLLEPNDFNDGGCDSTTASTWTSSSPPRMVFDTMPPALADAFPSTPADIPLTNSDVPVAVGFDVVCNPLVPCDALDMAQLEWLSNFCDESESFPPATVASATPAGNVDDDVKPSAETLLVSSPMSVLEQTSSSSASSGDISTGRSSSSAATGACAVTTRSFPVRHRSKRPRPAAFSPRAHITVPLLPPSTESQVPLIYADAGHDVQYGRDLPLHEKKKTNKVTAGHAKDVDSELTERAVRRCTHCQIDRTPQWRLGPLGPKTLCNACGVRYKSGRLFPEYRPAASPTFVPALHSNSHKKVVEIRLKSCSRRSGSNLMDHVHRTAWCGGRPSSPSY